MVPPAADSSRPGRDATAPEKAPFSLPNSSLSTRVSENVAQFTATKGPACRPDQKWSA
jgi:hypothetical protein